MTLKPGDINLSSYKDMEKLGEAPYDYFEMLRRDAPVSWNPAPDDGSVCSGIPDAKLLGYWVLSKHEDVSMASKDPARFSAADDHIFQFSVKHDPDMLASHQSGLMGMDPPQHTQFRRLIQPGFMPRLIGELEPSVRAAARRVIDEVAGRDEFEFAFDVAAHLPVILLCDLMGIPQEKREEYLDLGTKTANFEQNENFVPDQIQLFMLLDEVVKTVTDAPDDTLISKYVHGEVDGERLVAGQITQFFQTLSIAGQETTRNSTAHFVRLMDEYPEQKALLLEDLEGRLPNAIEEVLRFSPPVMQFCRNATEDMTLRGVDIKKGDKVYMSYVSANRDEDVFEDPNTFDILRPNASKHLAFGMGAHFCLGASLARLQLNAVLTELYTQLPDIALTGTPTPQNSCFFNAITEMPVRGCPVAH